MKYRPPRVATNKYVDNYAVKIIVGGHRTGDCIEIIYIVSMLVSVENLHTMYRDYVIYGIVELV